MSRDRTTPIASVRGQRLEHFTGRCVIVFLTQQVRYTCVPFLPKLHSAFINVSVK
jgi:hypothetical protein